ncbi:recombinase family protein [Streptomyces sp. NPDC005808]|uniref:recombinase family protein n=1 Tax=Streptomyces sp. NPDC005808 TaxID=3364734 RepID=UPI0036B0F2B7
MTPFQNGATYNRISKADVGDEDGVIRQGEDTAALALRRGIPVADQHRYVDNNISATSGKHRPQYEALMTAVQRGEVDCIIVTYMSRLWRGPRERLDGMEILKKHRVPLLTVKGPEFDLTTAQGRLMAGVIGEFDTFEVEQMREREQREALQRAERGEFPTGPRCFGYTATGGVIVEDEAAEVKAMFEALLAGANVSGIAADLNARGVLNRNGKSWTHNSVRGVLLNERYAGIREFRGEEYAGTGWSPIVDEDVWRKAVAVLTDDARKTSPGPARKHLLSGIARCGVCNNGTTVTSAQRGDGKTGYKCRGKVKHLMRVAEPIDALITNTDPAKGPMGVVIQILSRPDARALLADEDRPDAAELRTRATALRARLDTLADAFADDDEADPVEYKAAAKRIKARLAKIEAEMAHPTRGPVLAGLVGAEDVPAAWDALPLDRKRAVINLLMTVTIHRAGPGRAHFRPETVVIEPRLG